MRVPQLPSIQEAVELYYEKPLICAGDIKNLFRCGSAKACELKKTAIAKMNELNVPVWNARLIDTDTAFQAWGLDIKKLESRLSKLQKFKKTSAL